MTSFSNTAARDSLIDADYTLDHPVQYARGVVHPVTDMHVARIYEVYTETVVITMPKTVLKDNAASWNQVNNKVYSNMARYYTLLTQLAGYFANMVPKQSAYDAKPPVLVFYSAIPKARYEIVDDDDESNGNEPILMDQEKKCENRDIVAMSLRVVMQTAKYTFGALLDDLLFNNERAPMKVLKTGRRPRKTQREYEFKTMTTLDYVNLCMAYSGDETLLDNPNNTKLPLWDKDNPINPVNVFTLARSMEIAKACGCADGYDDINNYAVSTGGDDLDMTLSDISTEKNNADIDRMAAAAMAAVANGGGDDDDEAVHMNDDDDVASLGAGSKPGGGKRRGRQIKITRSAMMHAFPFGGWNVYQIRPGHIFPTSISKFFFPHLTKLVVSHNVEETLWASLSKSANASKMYAACVNTDANAPERNDLEHLRARMQRRIRAIPKKDRRNPTVYTRMMHEIRLEGLKEWETIYNMNGDIGDSIKAIIKWDKEHLRVAPNFCMPMPLVSQNLTRMGSLLANLNMSMDTIFGVSSLNNEVISGWFGDIHCYWMVPLHCHTLYIGIQSAGKSFVIDTQMLLLIPGTYTESAYESDKAKAVEGKVYDMCVEFFPEVPPHMLGVLEGVQKGKTAGGNANTPAEALMKMRLATGRMPFKVKVVTEDGKHISIEVIGYCNVKFNGASNIHETQLPDPIAARFMVSNIQTGNQRKDGATPNVKSARASNPAVESAKTMLCYRMRRTQSIVSKIATLIGGGVLPPISMTATMSILLDTLKRAKAVGLSNTEAVRHIDRVVIQMQSVCLVRVIDLLFDSELCPWDPLTTEWQSEHLLMVIPYLFSTVEDVPTALAFVEKQFESPVTANVMRALRLKFPTVRDVVPQHGQLILANGQLGSSLPRRASEIVARGIEQPWQRQQQQQQGNYGRDDDNNVDEDGPGSGYQGFSNHPLVGAAYGSASFLSKQQYSIDRYTQPGWVHTDAGKIIVLARELHSNMNPQPQFESVRNALTTIAGMTTSANDPADPTAVIKVLSFGMNERGFAWSVLERPQQMNVLANCFKSVMSYPSAPVQTYVWPKCHPDHPFIFMTLRNEPLPTNPNVVMIDPDYFDKVQQEYTMAFASGIHTNRFDASVEPLDWARIFSQQSDIILDVDADQYSAFKHVDSLQLSADALSRGPPVVPRDQLTAIHAHYGQAAVDMMSVYPLCFLRIFNGKNKDDRDIARVSASKLVRGFKRIIRHDSEKQERRAKRQRMAETGAIEAASSYNNVDEQQQRDNDTDANADVDEEVDCVMAMSSPPVVVQSRNAHFCDADLVMQMERDKLMDGVKAMNDEEICFDDDEAYLDDELVAAMEAANQCSDE